MERGLMQIQKKEDSGEALRLLRYLRFDHKYVFDNI